MRELSEIQAPLALKAQRFQNPCLRFSNESHGAIDPPAELDTSDGPTSRFKEYRTKDLPSFYNRTTSLQPIGHYEADRRRDGLIDMIEQHMRSAVEVELRAWREHMLKKGVKIASDGPAIVNTGMFMSEYNRHDAETLYVAQRRSSRLKQVSNHLSLSRSSLPSLCTHLRRSPTPSPLSSWVH